MKQTTAAVLVTAAVLWLAATTMLAHDVTYEGTVASVVANRYAALDGVMARLEVKVNDRKRTMLFDITQATRLWRGNRTVTFVEANIRKDERVAVMVNHDEHPEVAMEIQLGKLQ